MADCLVDNLLPVLALCQLALRFDKDCGTDGEKLSVIYLVLHTLEAADSLSTQMLKNGAV